MRILTDAHSGRAGTYSQNVLSVLAELRTFQRPILRMLQCTLPFEQTNCEQLLARADRGNGLLVHERRAALACRAFGPRHTGDERSGGHGEAGCEHVTAGNIGHCESSSIGKIGGVDAARRRPGPHCAMP
jgi:hypothetical protein